jgi:hypothetical protein
MMCFDKPIGAIALGAALCFAGGAFAQTSGSPYFYRLEKTSGVYYAPGTPSSRQPPRWNRPLPELRQARRLMQ